MTDFLTEQERRLRAALDGPGREVLRTIAALPMRPGPAQALIAIPRR